MLFQFSPSSKRANATDSDVLDKPIFYSRQHCFVWLELCRPLVKYMTAEEMGIVPIDYSEENDNCLDD